MDKDIIRFFLFQYFFQSAKDAGSDVIQGLSAPHDIQIVIDGQLEKIHHLIEHFPMLRREADLRFYAPEATARQEPSLSLQAACRKPS